MRPRRGGNTLDKERFVSEIEAHSGMLYRVAWSILRNDDDCKDALQEAAMKAWEKRGTLREPSYFRTWITRILINACYIHAAHCNAAAHNVPEPGGKS